MLMLICYIFYRTHVPVAAVPVLNTPDEGRLRPKHDSAEIKPAQCCIKLVLFDLYYDARKHKIKKKKVKYICVCLYV